MPKITEVNRHLDCPHCKNNFALTDDQVTQIGKYAQHQNNKNIYQAKKQKEQQRLKLEHENLEMKKKFDKLHSNLPTDMRQLLMQ